MSTPLIDRYPGARPFADDPNDQRLFYGRDEEIDTLFHRACAARLLVLFGKSGLGKTSLLQAGVYPKLRERYLLPIPVRLNIQDTPLAIIKTSAHQACRNTGIDYTPGIGATLWEFFKTAMFWRGEVLLTPVLVFDQFEEIFTLKNAEERATLARELGDLFRGTLPQSVRQQRQSSASHASTDSKLSEQPPNVRVILSLREDFLGALQELAADIPSIFDDRVRLSPLSYEQAEQAIRAPAGLKQDAVSGGQFAIPPFVYADDALAEILVYLRGKSEIIEPFQLQLVCRDIEQQIAQQHGKGNLIAFITDKELGGRKRLDNIVQNFYRQTLAKLAWHDRRSAQRLCEEGLLNAEGFRLPVQENEILKSYKLSEKALAALVDSRLLRKEPRLESYFYELSHDSLARPILDSRPWKLTRKQRAFGYGGVVILITLMVFGYWQLQAKREAEAAQERAVQAREAAEEVLYYLVFDLRDKLEPMGRLDILEEVQRQINQYYEKMGIEEQPANILHQRAVAYENDGDRLFAQGKREKAQIAYQKRLILAQQVAALEPDNLNWQRDIALSFDRLGNVLKSQGKLIEAQQYFLDSMILRQKLTAQDTSNPGWQRDLSLSFDSLGMVFSDQGKRKEAQQLYQKSLAIRQKLAELDPKNGDWQRNVSVSYERLGDVLSAQGKLTEAQQYYQDSLAIRQKLTSQNPYNIVWHRDISLMFDRLGDLLNIHGKLAEAQQYYQDSLSIKQKLTGLDPSNTEWQRDVSESFFKLGNVLNTQGKLKDALQQYQNSLAISQKLVAHDPSDTEWQQDVSVSLNRLGDVLNAQGKQTGAQKYYQDSLVIWQKLANQDPSNTRWQRGISLSLDRLGDVLNAQGKLPEALQYYQDSLAIKQKLTGLDPSDTEWQRDVSVSFHRIGYVLSAQGKLTKGLQYYQEGLAILLKLNALDLTNTLWQRDLAGVYFELHRYSEAAEILKSLVAHALKQGDVQTNKQVLANDYHILARYELLNRKPKNALTSSKNGLNLNSNESMNTLINTNLAHSYLFSGQYRKAKELYLNNKDKKVRKYSANPLIIKTMGYNHSKTPYRYRNFYNTLIILKTQKLSKTLMPYK